MIEKNPWEKTAKRIFGRNWMYYTRSITNASFNSFHFHYSGPLNKIKEKNTIRIWER